MTLLKTDNGWKKTNASKSALPVGILFPYMGTQAPADWFICDGSTFDETVYSDLYNFLGTNVLPDLRECITKGTGVNSRGNAHKTVSLGAFQDNTVKQHSHTMSHTHTRGTMNIVGKCGGFILDGNQIGYSGVLTTEIISNDPNVTITGSGTTQITRGVYGINAANGWSGSTSEPSNASTGSTGSGSTSEAKATGVNYIIKAR